MCGIFGMVLFEKNNTNLFKVKTIIRRLAINSKSRGRVATGISIATKNGISMLKCALPADEFVKLPELRSIINDQIPRKKEFGLPYSIIGHTRHPTKGSKDDPNNNHPIKTGPIVGVHNGMIHNDDELFIDLNDHEGKPVERIGMVDSEIIFRLIGIHSAGYKSNYSNTKDHKTYNPTSLAISDTSAEIAGSYACALQDADNTKMLWLFRNHNPIAIHYYPSSDIMVFASEEDFIKNAVDNTELGEPEVISLEAKECMCINIKQRKYNTIKLQESTSKGRTLYGVM